MLKRWLVLCIFILLLSACGNQKTLKVGVEKTFEPFAYTEYGQEKGFDVDLWQEVANEEKINYEFVPMEQGEMFTALRKGKIDVALAGLTIKKDRKQAFDFTVPYYDTGLTMVVLSNNQDIENVSNLQNKIVATKIGSSAYDYIKKVKGIKQIAAYPNIEEAYQALVAKKADVVIFDKEHASIYAKTGGKGKVKIVGKELTKEQYGFALKKQSKYTGRINAALGKLGKNGAYERIYTKWFNEKPNMLPEE